MYMCIYIERELEIKIILLKGVSQYVAVCCSVFSKKMSEIPLSEMDQARQSSVKVRCSVLRK